MKKLSLTITLLFIAISVLGQGRRFRYKQYIPLKYLITDSYTIKNGDKVELEEGDILKTEKEILNGKKKSLFISSDTIKKGEERPHTFDKKITYPRRLKDKANVYVKDNDYSKLYLDFWLLSPTYFPKGSILTFVADTTVIKKDTLEKKGTKYAYYSLPNNVWTRIKDVPKQIDNLRLDIDSLKSVAQGRNKQFPFTEKRKEGLNVKKSLRDKEKALKNIYKESINQKYLWAAYAKEKMLLETDPKDASKTLTFYKKYPQTGYISLANRQYIKLNFEAIEIAALTIPFKFRPQVTVRQLTEEQGPTEDITVQENFTTNVNVNAFFGYTRGKIKYLNRASEKIVPQNKAFSVGGFLGFSAVEIDSVSTSFQKPKDRLSSKRTIITSSLGVGVNYEILDFEFGAFLGWDIGLGGAGVKWNYHRRPWLGFGVGYNLGILGRSLFP